MTNPQQTEMNFDLVGLIGHGKTELEFFNPADQTHEKRNIEAQVNLTSKSNIFDQIERTSETLRYQVPE